MLVSSCQRHWGVSKGELMTGSLTGSLGWGSVRRVSVVTCICSFIYQVLRRGFYSDP